MLRRYEFVALDANNRTVYGHKMAESRQEVVRWLLTLHAKESIVRLSGFLPPELALDYLTVKDILTACNSVAVLHDMNRLFLGRMDL